MAIAVFKIMNSEYGLFYHPLILKAVITAVSNNDKIQHRQVHELGSLHDFCAGFEVCTAGGWIPGGMVVRQDDSGSAGEQRAGEYLARVYWRTIAIHIGSTPL